MLTEFFTYNFVQLKDKNICSIQIKFNPLDILAMLQQLFVTHGLHFGD